jgi:hypothetical protein
MPLTSVIQIIKVGALQDKEWEGRKYQVQEAECLLLDENGNPDTVGVLRLSDEFKKAPPVPGKYMADFALRAATKNRQIGAIVVGLRAITDAQLIRGTPVAAPAAAKA